MFYTSYVVQPYTAENKLIWNNFNLHGPVLLSNLMFLPPNLWLNKESMEIVVAEFPGTLFLSYAGMMCHLETMWL